MIRCVPSWQSDCFPVSGLLNGNIALAPCPSGAEHLDGEIRFLQQQGYRLVISMLTIEEQEEHGLTQEAQCCKKYGINYLNFPIRDEVADSDEATLLFVHKVKQQTSELASDDKILFHCRGGVGRSSMMIALVLATDSLTAESIFVQISLARGEDAPESAEQRQWVEKLCRIMNESNQSN